MALTQSYQDHKPGILSRLFSGLVRSLEQVTEANSRISEVERFQAMSDEALASRGIKREDIVRHRFRDVFWL